MKVLRNTLISLLTACILQVSLSAQPLSEAAEISVLTCGPGDQLYSLFGHSAIRVYDEVQGIDKVYNYGTFDFEAPNFAMNFLRGKLTFWVTVTTFDRFLQEYYYFQRKVEEQVLRLSDDEVLSIYRFLEENIRPENRTYQYDFYFDNCTTRLRDLVEQGIALEYPRELGGQKTFRDLLHENLVRHPWTRFGMDIILGMSSDRIAGPREQMFLPEYYLRYLDEAKRTAGQTPESVVKSKQVVFDFPVIAQAESILPSPTVLFGALLGIEILLFFLTFIAGHPAKFNWMDKVWFMILFVSFLVFVSMWFLTDHAVCRYNWNILWTCPWMIFCLFKKHHSRMTKVLLWLTVVASISLVAGWQFIPQSMPGAVILIAIINALKAFKRLGVIRWIDAVKKPVAVTLLCCLAVSGQTQEKMMGITMVGTPSVHLKDPFPPIQKVHANWVALVPFAFSRQAMPEVRWGSNNQWWGERSEGVIENLRLARSHGMKVMIKPQVWIPRGWVGDMDFQTEAEWSVWEESYRAYILHYVDIAEAHDAALFCVGTEFRIAVEKRELFWRQLIKDIRARYNGKLIYSANWDSYDAVPFWDDLDYIGISSYFPLSSISTPPQMLLNIKWKSIKRKLEKYSGQQGKQIVFTEFGYLSVDGTAGKTWELEKDIRNLKVNEKAQANAYAALLSNFVFEDFWAGGFLWKWFPNGQGHEGYPEKDYTPQGKMSENKITSWYLRAREQ